MEQATLDLLLKWNRARLSIVYEKQPDDCCYAEGIIVTHQFRKGSHFCRSCHNQLATDILKEEFLKQTKVQTLILLKRVFDTLADARKWVKDHGFVDKKVDTTENTWRFRQFPPGKCKSGTFRTISMTKGVQAGICVPKGNTTPTGLKTIEEMVCGIGDEDEDGGV